MNCAVIISHCWILYHHTPDAKIISLNYPVCSLQSSGKLNLFFVQERFCSVTPHRIIYSSLKTLLVLTLDSWHQHVNTKTDVITVFNTYKKRELQKAISVPSNPKMQCCFHHCHSIVQLN